MSPRVPALAVVLLAILALGTVAVAAGGGADVAVDGVGADNGSVDGVAAQQTTPTNVTLPPEETVIEIQLEADGDARWTVTERFTLTDEAEVAAFDDLGGSFEARTQGSLGLTTFQQAVEEANAETTRSMAIRNPEHVVERENASLEDVRALNGTYTLSFTWTNFAREDGDSYVVDDAFNTSTGTWFGGLTANERLVIALPPGHGASAAPKAFEQNELRWEGPVTFESGYLHIVYSGGIAPPNPQGPGAIVWAALAIAALALVVAAVLLARRRGVDPAAVIGGLGSEDGTEADDEPEETPAAGQDAESAATAEGEKDDLELLSDEERVERLLDENGGRMKQANIVKETGWSNAKVSQLLSSMEDEDRITKLRIGRENLIAFPDEDVGEFET